MLGKFLDIFRTISGSARDDAVLLAGRIARRCDDAFQRCRDEGFRELGGEVLLVRRVLEDSAACSDEQARVILKTLIELEKRELQLEVDRGLRMWRSDKSGADRVE
jgi:hypothetical protein